MKDNNLNNKFIKAAKWSTFTELFSKMVSPITNIILARLLAPEAFGVIATITMIISFADMFTDAGFQKYIVQHDFEDEEELFKNANVAFITNLIMSIIIWGIIIIFRNHLAVVLGNGNLGNVLAIAAFQLPLTSFSSIQMALFRRNLDFKPLFFVRMFSVFIPFFVTVPLAFLGLSYWALIIGTITMQLSNAIILTLKSNWKPKLYYEISILAEMLSFSIWSLIEALTIWLATWIDSFIIGSVLSQYYLGLYKTSTSLVNTLMTIITASVAPVLFSTLSRIQDDDSQFVRIYLKVQRVISIIVLPLGVGIFIYDDLVTKILLGDAWNEAGNVIGIWALTTSIMIVFEHFCSEVYRSKGKPKISILAQVLHLVVLVPACIISSKFGFWSLVYTRAWIRMEAVVIHLIIMKWMIGLNIKDNFKNVMPSLIAVLAMGLLGGYLQKMDSGIWWDLLSIALCSVLYFGILLLFPSMRKEARKIINIRG